jgi:hypothetical protein
MKLRDWMNNNSAVVTIGAVVLLIGALAAIIFQMKPSGYGPRVIDVYYFDLNTQKLFTAKSDQIPPIETPSGPVPGIGAPAGVRAYVFACNDCGNESDRFVGWLEMYTPEAKALLTQPAAETPEEAAQREARMYEVWETGQLLSLDGRSWARANSQEAMNITSTIEGKCPGGAPKPCLPGR